jgi:hypothetical protein
MNYVGVDIHKRYSFVSATDEQGHRLREARIEGNAPGSVAWPCRNVRTSSVSKG